MYIGTLSASPRGLNIQSINQSAAIKNEALNGIKADRSKTDMIAVSPAGKKQSMIEQLMKQKEALQERKESLINSAAENGTSGLDLQLKEYEQQMKDIDQQILQLQSKDKVEKESEDNTGKIYEKPKTKEEMEKDQLDDLTALTNGTDHAEVITSVKNQIDGKIRAMNAEVHSINGSTASKLEKIAQLESRSNKLTSEIAEKLGDSLDSISKRNEDAKKPENEVQADETDNPLSSADSKDKSETDDSQS
jgi:Mg2+ and Co2+ transporter CorA